MSIMMFYEPREIKYVNLPYSEGDSFLYRVRKTVQRVLDQAARRRWLGTHSSTVNCVPESSPSLLWPSAFCL